MKKILIVAGTVLLAAAAVWFMNRGGGDETRSYRFVAVESGDLESVVSTTGTLEAVTTVQVGTQVSGRIAEILADFNDHVTEGQTIARIDTTLLVIAVRDMKANLERSAAEFSLAEQEHARARDLHGRGIVSDVDLEKAVFDLDIARASLKSAQINLDKAKQNLDYATILAPISGTVIERNVDVGQTVAASFSAPQLFLIAKDLSKMHILASVDESDIGLIREGQSVRFTVQTYPEETFIGAVSQVRLQSRMQENVVNYTVVVTVENKDGKLLPGMTATVNFLIETAAGVIKVANAALRFTPPGDLLAEFRTRMQEKSKRRPGGQPEHAGGANSTSAGAETAGAGGGTGSVSGSRNSGMGGFGPGGSAGGTGAPGPGRTGMGGEGGSFGGHSGNSERPKRTMLWYLDEQGKLAAAPVRTGITDGQMTEIEGEGIKPGMQVIAGILQSGQSAVNNPFQNQQQRQPGPPRPGF